MQENCNFIKFSKSKIAQAPLFLNFEQSFFFFYNLRKLFMIFFFFKFGSARIRIQKNCWIQIRIK